MSNENYDNPYNPFTDNFENETPTHDQVIDGAIESKLYDLHTWLPAKIVKVKGNQKVDIQPLLKRKYKDGTLVLLPVIQDVPVYMPRGAAFYIKLPVAVGDTGIALFSERSLDVWKVQGGTVDPQDPRRHDISDAVFLPGLYPFNNQIAGAAADMVLKNGSLTMTLKPTGKIQIANTNNELISILSELLDTLKNNTYTLTQLGPQPFIASTKTALQTLKDKIDTLKEG